MNTEHATSLVQKSWGTSKANNTTPGMNLEAGTGAEAMKELLITGLFSTDLLSLLSYSAKNHDPNG